MNANNPQATLGDNDKTRGRVLVVDDEESILSLLRFLLEDEFDVELAETGELALSVLEKGLTDVVLSDKNLPGISGLQVLESVRKRWPQTEVIMITAYASLDSAIKALRLGAFDYIPKPFPNNMVVLEKVRRALEKKRLVEENRQMQVSLAQADRMATVGVLAAGVAHEINNPLVYILYNLQSLSESMPRLTAGLSNAWSVLTTQLGREKGLEALGPARSFCEQGQLDDLVDLAAEAVEGAMRVRNIVRDLKVFSRVEEDRRVPVSINKVIESAINMAYNEIRYRARLVKEYGAIPAVLATEGRLSQVFLNLLVNAAHAIKEGSTEQNEIRVATSLSNGEIRVEVIDTGEGIAPENLDKLFTPFFTTKPIGVGSGLGLSICHKIVESYDGRIEVESQPGHGTRFSVIFPVQPEANEPTGFAGQKSSTDQPRRASIRGRFLVIDDEPMIGKTIRRLLRADHDVETVTSGTAAKELLEKDPGFDLVLCDLMMPSVSGIDIHEWLEQTNPSLARRMVFITGGAVTPRAKDFVRRIPNVIVEKPFEPNSLRSLLNNMIDPPGKQEP